MPLYIFSEPGNPKNKIEILQAANDTHEFYDKNGIKWNREFTVPQASVDTKIDPLNSKNFVERTRNKRGSVGDLWEESQRYSEARQKKIGHDPVKQEWFDNYAKTRRGKRHRNDPKRKGPGKIKI